ncbi:AAA domain-containing protein [Dyadobacter tibetensis]|uniref:AAA domain-containing protein n=1 Tax=Dyadobacter tibetensis TaxID=1211851 RepID=UPI0004724870|nr:AAA domain-containing protein [Dyadobacter tibetensis]
MHQILKVYLKRLTNLSTRNKSLLLTSLPGEQFLDLQDTDHLLNRPAFDAIVQLIADKKSFPICDVQDPRFEKVNLVSKRLRKISRTEKFVADERGTQDLYVGYPFLKGKLADGTPIHGPLLFFPVTLTISKEQWCLAERGDSRVILNRSIALAYSYFNESPLSEDVLDKSFEEFSSDALTFRTELYEWLKETGLKINFNQAIFENKLQAFEALKSADLKLLERNGELRLVPEAVLGIFPQAGSYLVPDYQQMLEEEGAGFQSVLLPGLEQSPEDLYVEPEPTCTMVIKEEDVLTPFPVDESQEEIILEVKRGKSVVVQGPPGSGKSQLICNLVSDFISKGKRVLVVCQKRAALDVVHDRLESIGLDPFVGLIHDFKNDRSALYGQLKNQIEQVEGYRAQNYSLDAVFIERQFVQESRQIDRVIRELDNFREALFDETLAGESAKSLYLRCDMDAPHFDVENHYRTFRLEGRNEFSRNMGRYLSYALRLRFPHPWHDRKPFIGYNLSDLRAMERLLQLWPEAWQQVQNRFTELTGVEFSLKYLEQPAQRREELTDLAGWLEDSETFLLFKKYLGSASRSSHRMAFIRQIRDEFDGFVAEDGVALQLATEELSECRSALLEAIHAKESMLSGKLYDWFNKNNKRVATFAAEEGLGSSLRELKLLENRLLNRIQLEQWLGDPLLGFEPGMVRDGSAESFQAFLARAEAAMDALQQLLESDWADLLLELGSKSGELSSYHNVLFALRSWLQDWQELDVRMQKYFSFPQGRVLLHNPESYSRQLSQTLAKDFDALCEMDDTYASLSEPETQAIDAALDYALQVTCNDPEELLAAWINSLELAWIDHIEQKYPILRTVSSQKLQHWESDLQAAVQARQRLARDIVGIRVREHTYKDIEKNRLGNRVTYRELDHQVTKKRRVWPVRKLLEAYADDIFNLIPCWLASPESVSAMFPLERELFDLVIFDEASQCYAEFGLPAAARGRQVVVAGDAMQLAPSDLYRVRYEEQDELEEYLPALEVDSLLSLAAQSLGQYSLTGHYRSLSLDLIAFSNRHFYSSKLKLLPDFLHINAMEPGITYLKTEGIWAQNANVVEADLVADIISSLAATGKSIGVVTFNFHQQQCIQERLEAGNIEANGLFVKNIENVQGDERDVIIFSMGYAPDEKGKISMQFGSLNAQGGENRLNVAVTRAREKIFFVSSLWPDQLHTEGATNEGPRLLKAYMQFALSVSEGKFRPQPSGGAAQGPGWLLKEKLISQNPALSDELPFGDITIKEGAAFKALVLTDDEVYYHSRTAKEPHAYLPLLLKLKNWPFKRVYSREYWSKTLELVPVD